MRVVLDTNIFISGIHWHGVCEEILNAWSDDRFELVSSEEIIQELANTLANFRKPLSEDDILHWISIIIGKAIIVEPKEKFKIVKDDPDDDKFIEAGIEGNADYIVSQDKHLLKLKRFKGLKILNPRELIKRLDI